ncbi:MAG: ribosome recycling factor [Dehalococcoidales bacterium]|jgi:ribosome recycling factor|nr:ribosome recycling factor [Dehalococcoidales bacterium]
MADNQSLTGADQKMRKSLEVVQRELVTIRTGRASPALIEHMKVDYAGSVLPLNQLASITTPNANMLVVQPWDKSSMNIIEKAILKSDLGLTPINDGRMIRINIPPLSEERRQELLKVVRRRIEEGKIAIRNVRRDALEDLKTQEKDKDISQDELKHLQNQLQKLTDAFTVRIEQAGKDKEKEVMED